MHKYQATWYQQIKGFVSSGANKATTTLYDLLASILFKLAHSCLNAFSLVQSYIVNSKESSRQIAPSETSLTPSTDFYK